MAKGNSAYTCVEGILYTKDLRTLILAPKTLSGTVTLPSGLVTISTGAFSDCYDLAGVVLPSSLTTLEAQAFANCISISSFTIPANVTTIGANAIPAYLSSIAVESGNTAYRCTGNCLIEIATKTLLLGCGDITIPADGSVTTIADSAFMSSKLKSVVIPEGITALEDYAFAYSYNLTTITLPATLTRIGRNAFFRNSSLKTVIYGSTQEAWAAISIGGGNDSLTNATIQFSDSEITPPEDITSGAYGSNLTWALEDDGTLTISGTGAMTNYSSVEDIPYYVHREKITAVMVSPGVTTIGNYAFRGLSNLTSVSLPQGLTAIEFMSFQGCERLEEIHIPEGVTAIHSHAFRECNAMASLTIPASVTTIGNSALPISLTSLTIASGNSTYHCAGNCLINTQEKTLIAGFQNSVIPADGSVTTISSEAFSFVPIKTISVPEGVTSIATFAFAYCAELESIVLPRSLTSIGNFAFFNCSRLKLVGYGGTTEAWAAISLGSENDSLTAATIRYQCDDVQLPAVIASGTCGSNLTWVLDDHGTLSISGSGAMATQIPWRRYGNTISQVTIAPGVTAIAAEAFYGCRQLVSVTLPEGITSLGDYAFYGCRSLSGITLPESLTSLGEYAFYNCSSLSSITIPANVSAIGENAFQSCQNLKEIQVSPSSTFFWSDDSGVLYSFDKTTLLAFPAGFSGSYTFPDTVTTITPWSLAYATGLTGVTLPDSLTTIGLRAFYECTQLTTVTLPAGVTTLGESPFAGCSSLNTIRVAEENTAFRTDSRGVLYTQDQTRLICAPGTFSGDYTIPQGVTAIDSLAFDSCTGLTGVALPGTLTSTGYSTFAGCSGLTWVTIGEGVTTLGSYTFSSCNNLTQVTLPETLVSIAVAAFRGATSLTDVYYGGSAAS